MARQGRDPVGLRCFHAWRSGPARHEGGGHRLHRSTCKCLSKKEAARQILTVD